MPERHAAAAVPAPYDLAGAVHDVDTGPGAPRRSYVLCSMPRSGSSLLSEGLHAAGLGTPIEYFDRTNTFAVCARRWGTTGSVAYLRALHRYRTTPDGMFGAKLHWPHLDELTGGLVEEGALSSDADDWSERRRAALDALAPGGRFVLVTRRDHDRQAVSWFVAERTGRWSSVGGGGSPRRDVTYDGAAIERHRRALVAGDAAWRTLFERAVADVVHIVYEDLVSDYEAGVRTVAEHVGMPLPEGPLPPPRLRRQSDDRTEELVERFRADRDVRP